MEVFMMSNMALLTHAMMAALEAGREILSVYDTDFSIEHKEDTSPLTLADKQAHQVITRRLAPFEIPILSEEGRNIAFHERQNWKQLWIVDPLDGTKEFIKRNGEFTVNIALVRAGKPVLGVVYWPVKDILYLGDHETGACKIQKASTQLKAGEAGDFQNLLDKAFFKIEKLPLKDSKPSVFTIVGSRSHPSPELEALVEKIRKEYGGVDFISAGSALKICLVAEGAADLYPRLGPTMEWDTAAGQAVAEASGASVLDYEKKTPLTYNKENLLNPWFVVKTGDRR
jgi:3'(2'), 5'-bisphosphate nucleotidase